MSLEISISVLEWGGDLAWSARPTQVLLQDTILLPSHLLGACPGSAKGMRNMEFVFKSKKQTEIDISGCTQLPVSFPFYLGCGRCKESGHCPFQCWNICSVDQGGFLGL